MSCDSFTHTCRYLASGTREGCVSTYDCSIPRSASSSTMTGDEDICSLPPPHPASLHLSPQTHVITPLHSSFTGTSPSLLSVGGRAPRNPAPRVDYFGRPGSQGGSREKSSNKTGKPRRQSRTRLPKHLSETLERSYATGPNYHYPLESSPSYSSVDVKSTVTTSSEIDFRNNLASLDADIARLQMQFKVARQPQ